MLGLDLMATDTTSAFARSARCLLHSCGPLALALAMVGAAVVGVTSLPTAVAADTVVKGEILVILAKAEPGEFDARLAAMPTLHKPPFDGYKSMQLLSTAAVRLDNKNATIAELPKGRKLMLKLLGRTADGRHRVQVSINKPGKPDYLPLLTVIASKLPFFVAGQNYQGGTLVIGVRIDQ